MHCVDYAMRKIRIFTLSTIFHRIAWRFSHKGGKHDEAQDTVSGRLLQNC